MTKIKYLSGKRKDEVVELDDAKATSLVEDGLGELIPKSEIETVVDGLKADFEAMAKDVTTKATAEAVSTVSKSFKNSIRVGEPRELQDMTGGFKSLAHFLKEVKRSGEGLAAPTQTMVKYLNWEDIRAKTGGATPSSTEGTASLTNGAAGDGAAIPVEYVSDLVKMWGDQPDFAAMCFPVPMNSLSVHMPVLRNYDRSNSTNTAGLIATEDGENVVKTLSKVNWEQRLLTCVVESILAPITNETLEDNNVNIVNAISGQAIYQLRKRINGGILNGTTSSCVGILGSSGTTGTGVHASTKLVGRALASHIGFADILKMYAAFDHEGADFSRAVWVGNPGIVAEVFNSTIGSVTSALIAPGDGKNGVPMTILGRPLYLTGYASALGTTGDLALIDFKQYLFGSRSGLNTFISPHVYAASNQTAIRFTQRVVGSPLRTGLVTLEDGSSTVSSSVVLAQVGSLS